MILQLVTANLFARRARTLLTVLAIALSVSLVVAMTSGFKSFEAAAFGYMDRLLGAVDATVKKEGDLATGIDGTLLDELKADRDVRHAFGRLETALPSAVDAMGQDRGKLIGVDKATDPLLDWVELDEGRWFAPGESGMVVDSTLLDRLKLKVGDTYTLPGPGGVQSLPVLGKAHTSGALALFTSSKAYVPLSVAEQHVYGGGKSRLTRINVQFNPNTDAAEFAGRWQARLKAIDPQLQIELQREKRADMDRNFLGMRILAGLGASVTLVSAMFLIFSTLSMGVSERQRTLAMMRAVGMSRWQLARLVIFESALLAGLGILTGIVLGFFLAAGVVALLNQWFNDLTTTLDPIGLILATVGAGGAAVLASVIPAWQAARVDPLTALNPLADAKPAAFPIWPTVAGLILVLIDPAILFFPGSPETAELRLIGHLTVGVPTLMFGFFFLAPAFVYVITLLFEPLLSFVLRLPATVLREHLSGGLWRSAGTCTSLMVGLATLIVMHTQGHSALSSWKLPDRFPDVFIFTRSITGLTPKMQQAVRDSELLNRRDVMPLATFAPSVGGGFLGLVATRLPNSTMFIAIEPDKGFRLMELDFRQGSPEEAQKLLEQGRHLIVTEDFAKTRNVSLGGTVTLNSPKNGPIDFTVAAVIWSPGIDVMVSAFDLGPQVDKQSASCVFGSFADATKYFGVDTVWLMCANFAKPGGERETLVEQLQSSLGDTGVSVADVRKLKTQITDGINTLLNVASSIAWGALAIASLGVTNTIIASIRSRMYQFGVLRSVGLTRFALLRIVCGEALLLGITAAVMGAACAALVVFDARKLLDVVVGQLPPLSIPWPIVWIGLGVVVLVSLLASVVPAWRVSRTAPLRLLQAGRSAA